MHVHRFLSSLIVTAVLLTPIVGQAAAAAQTRETVKAGVTVRVFDRSHNDYHVWDDQEDQTYRKYLNDNHQTYRPIANLTVKQQTNYWNSRHANDKK